MLAGDRAARIADADAGLPADLLDVDAVGRRARLGSHLHRHAEVVGDQSLIAMASAVAEVLVDHLADV